MTKLRINIGQQIAMLRKKHGLTIRELSELSKIENGKYNISIDIIERICKSLGASVKIDIMHTLEELRDFINSNEDWELTTNKIIELNGWTDETGDNYGICNDGNRRLYLTVSNGVLVPDIFSE